MKGFNIKGLKIALTLTLFLNIFALILTGCGTSDDKDNHATQATTIISGVASKGLIKGGKVTAYALNADGSQGAQIGTAITDPNGAYSINLGSYTGSVLLEINGGTYIDEATGNPNIPAPPLRAALTNAQGRISAAITPLTEIAVQCAGSALTKDKIEGANYLVGTALGVGDIIHTLPHDATKPAGQPGQGGIRYGLILAALSQMANDNGASIENIINNLKDDLTQDYTLNSQGTPLSNALSNFVTSNSNNKTGINAVPEIISAAIQNAIQNPIIPPTLEPTPAAKAKKLVADLRNTVRSIYNSQNQEVQGVIKTPFVNLAQELETKIKQQLSLDTQRIGWIINSSAQTAMEIAEKIDNLDSIQQRIRGLNIPNIPNIPDSLDSTYTYYSQDNTLKLEITLTEANPAAGSYSASFTVNNVSQDPNVLLDKGSLTLSLNESGKVVSGTLTASMAISQQNDTGSTTGTVTANLHYTGTYQNNLLAKVILTGSITAPGELSFDFSQEGRKLEVTFAPTPPGTYILVPSEEELNESEEELTEEEFAEEELTEEELPPELEGYIPTTLPEMITPSVYPTRIFFSGRAKTATAQMDGNVDIADITWYDANSIDCSCSVSALVSQRVMFEGSFKELKGGSASGAKFSGKISGQWLNAEDFNFCLPQDPNNYPKWTASFDGKIEIPQQPTLAAYLTVSQTGYQLYTLNVSYRKSCSDGTVVYLEGSGSLNAQTKQLTATLNNQDGMAVNISYDDTKPKNEKLTGSITAPGGAKMADIYLSSGLPMVKYIADDYIESVF